MESYFPQSPKGVHLLVTEGNPSSIPPVGGPLQAHLAHFSASTGW